MPTVNAEIPTDRAGRYLAQLCRHLSQMSRMRHRPTTGHGGQAPPAVEDVDWSDTAGTIRFSHGTCTLQASSNTLMLRIDADNEDARIGCRKALPAGWRRSADATASPSTGNSRRRRPTVQTGTSPPQLRNPPPPA